MGHTYITSLPVIGAQKKVHNCWEEGGLPQSIPGYIIQGVFLLPMKTSNFEIIVGRRACGRVYIHTSPLSSVALVQLSG